MTFNSTPNISGNVFVLPNITEMAKQLGKAQEGPKLGHTPRTGPQGSRLKKGRKSILLFASAMILRQ